MKPENKSSSALFGKRQNKRETTSFLDPDTSGVYAMFPPQELAYASMGITTPAMIVLISLHDLHCCVTRRQQSYSFEISIGKHTVCCEVQLSPGRAVKAAFLFRSRPYGRVIFSRDNP